MNEAKRSRILIRNEAKILRSAQRAFANHGFKGATMEMIAEAADMSQPNLHNYYRTKVDLYRAVLDQTLDIWLVPLTGLNGDGDPREEMQNYISQKLSMARQFPEASRIFAHEILSGGQVLKPQLRNRVKAAADSFADIVQGWAKAGKMRPVDPHHLLFMIWASTQHYADFAPQVRAILDVRRLGLAEFGEIQSSLCSIMFDGLFDKT
jgi:TetR/AcrR family transcriptional regulator